MTRAISKTRKSIDALAHEMGLSKTSAQAFIRVYQMMVEADDTIPSKWSYYFELDKRKDIKDADENNPAMGIKQTVIDMIKDNKFLKKLSEAETEELLKKSIRALTELEDWDADHLQETLNT